jgi:hypothetical protein
MRCLFGFMCVLTLGVMGCGETPYVDGDLCCTGAVGGSAGRGGTGGSGGDGGVGGMGGGGTGGAAATSDLEGTWQFETMEVREMTTDCPGEIVIIPVVWVCPEGTYTFNGNDTFVAIEEAYEPDPPYRGEGTWSTVGDTLTMTYLRQGTSTEDLEPTDPPDLWVVRWSVSGTTLMLIHQGYLSDPPATYTLRRR